MALAQKLHHSANRTVLPKEEVEQHYAQRGQKRVIESDSAKAAFGHALVGDIRFFIKGSFRLDDWVAFLVGESPHTILDVTWPRLLSILAVVRTMLVLLVMFLFALYSLQLSAGLACRHHGRQEPEGQSRGNYIVGSGSGMCYAGYAGTMLSSRCLPFCCLEAPNARIVKQKTAMLRLWHVHGWFCPLRRISRCC